MPVQVFLNGRPVSGVEEAFERIIEAIVRAIRQVPKLAGPDLAMLMRTHHQEVIRETFTRRDGHLERVRVRRRARRGYVDLTTDYPRTAYLTPPNRGRPRASKQGQYAFVLNHQRRWIQRANRAFRRDPRIAEIIQRHLALAIQRELESLGSIR